MKKVIMRFSLLLVIALLFLSSHSHVAAVEYGGIGGRPAFPDPSNSRTDSIFVHTISPGGEVQDGIRLLNNTSETKTLLVYAVDSVVSSGGAFSCAQSLEEKKDVGSWISLKKSEVTLASLTNEIVPFTITLPPHASVGEHNGCIIVEEKKTTSTTPSQNGIVLSFRTGLRVAVLVPGEIIRQLETAGLSINKKESGDTVFVPRLHNSGNVSIDANVEVKVKSFYGKTMAIFGGDYPILRGETSEWNFDFKRPFFGGYYKVSYAASYDPSPEAGVGVKSGKPLVVLTEPSVWFWSTPTLYGFLIELGVLGIIAICVFLWLRSWRRKKWIKSHWVTYTVQNGEDIRSISSRYGISWKLLVKVNKILPPYTLSAGIILRVPPEVE